MCAFASLLMFIILFATDGVTLSLNGRAIANNSYVDVRDIGDSDDNALLCHTDKINCCRLPNKGEWYYPNGINVKQYWTSKTASPDNYYYRNRGPRVVRLKRVGNPHQRGLFWCEVINQNNENQTIFVNIGMCNEFTYINLAK